MNKCKIKYTIADKIAVHGIVISQATSIWRATSQCTALNKKNKYVLSKIYVK